MTKTPLDKSTQRTFEQTRRDYIALIKRNRINLILFFISLSISTVIGYYLYNYLRKPSEMVVYHGETSDYELSFFNSKGQALSALTGTLKLVLDPFTIYANYPNQISASYSINARGFRKGYLDNEASQLAIVVGGSAAFGQGLPENNKTFASRLSRDNQKYNVMNSAVIGFLSGQELSLVIHYLDDFDPSLYIVFDGWNDIFDPFMFAQNWPIKVGPIGFNRTFFQIENNLGAFNRMQKEKDAKLLESMPPLDNFLKETEYFQKVKDEYISNIDKMNAFANARGARFLLVFQPELGNKKTISDQEQKILKDWSQVHGYLDKEIPQKYKQLIVEAQKFCVEENIACLNLNEEPAFSKNPQTLFYDAVHPNELGHQIIAEIINKMLLEDF